MSRIQNFHWQHWLLIIGFALSLAIAGFFAFQAIRYAPRAHKDEPIRPWMNIPYIAHSYHVPAHVLFQALGEPSRPLDRRPILEIARQQQRSVESITLILQEAITQYRLAGTATPIASPSPLVGTP